MHIFHFLLTFFSVHIGGHILVRYSSVGVSGSPRATGGETPKTDQGRHQSSTDPNESLRQGVREALGTDEP